MMHIVMHVKSTKRLPTYDVIYSIVQWYLKKCTIYGGSFGPSMIVRLFHWRFFHGPIVVNGRWVPLDMTDSERKRK